MKINKALILIFSALLIVIPGCEDETTDPVNEFEVLVEWTLYEKVELKLSNIC
jgi:hypothetical protein